VSALRLSTPPCIAAAAAVGAVDPLDRGASGRPSGLPEEET
jgi:hypothetical protein